jgi:glutamyl-tRNA synthetase
MMRFLLVAEEQFTVDEAAAGKHLGDAGRPVLEAASAALDSLPEWSAAAIEEALRAALVEGLGLKPRNAFGPVRVAVTGSTVSPPLFESMEILGRDRSLGRLGNALS